MAKVRPTSSSGSTKRRRPALNPEARENQLISLAIDLVEQRLLDGTASSQETTHFLKLGSTKAILEKEKLRKENELLDAKAEDIRSSRRNDEIYKEAIEAFRTYRGLGDDSDEEY